MLFLLTVCGKDEDAVQETAADTRVKQMGIILTANTSLRVDPLIITSRIAQLKKGEIAEVLERSAVQQKIAGNKNYWYKIRLSNGITGWVFGRHINIIDKANNGDVESYLSSFWEKENEELSRALHGKWWSINRFGEYTNHCLEIYSDGTYKSYIKGASTKIEGSFNFDFNKNQVIFLAGTSFEGELNYVLRGNLFSLYRDTANGEIRFKKINTRPESPDEVSENDGAGKPDDEADSLKKTDED